MQKPLFIRLSEPNYVVKGYIIPTYPKMHNFPVPTVGTGIPYPAKVDFTRSVADGGRSG